MKHKIDVLICSYNEAKNIPALLDSLVMQSVGRDAFHVIFVDNNSTDNTREIVSSYHNKLRLDYIFEPNQGKSNALNTGYKLALCDYVAQTDADCKVDERWVENISRTIEAEKPDALGGPYYPYYNIEKPKWFKDEYNRIYLGDHRKLLRGEFLSGANTIWRRELVYELNGYKKDFSIVKGGLTGGEDTELIVRAVQKYKNLKIIYDPSIVVFHLTKKKDMIVFNSVKWSWSIGLRIQGIFHTNEYKLMSWVSIVKVILKTCLEILYVASIGIMTRDRGNYPYYQCYIVEVIAPKFCELGKAYSELHVRLFPIYKRALICLFLALFLLTILLTTQLRSPG